MNKIAISVLTAFLSMFALTGMAQDELWVVGDGVPGGSVEMRKMPDGSFKYAGKLKYGSLQVATTATKGSDTRYLKPRYEDSYVVNNGVPYTLSRDSAGSVWSVPFDEDYFQIHIVPASSSSGTFEGKLHIPWHYAYIGGGATENGWDMYAMQVMTQDENDPCVFTWTGTLRDNSDRNYEEPRRLKILGQMTWGSNKYFHPYKQDEPLVGSTDMRFNGDDTKWQISTDGVYTITINTLQETIHAYLVSSTNGGATAVDNAHVSDVSIKAGVGSVVVKSAKPVDITVANVLGQTVGSAKGQSIVVDGLKAGLYVVKAGNVSKKIIIR